MTTIGIDLGTSNSLVTFWSDSGPQIIPNVLGEHLTPSVVGVDDNGHILVGQIAKERLVTHPHLTIAAFKRHMGSSKQFQLGEHQFSPEELSSLVLKVLKQDAEAYLKTEVSHAIISVPAYFNDQQRKATKLAAEYAGLVVDRLISEPTAAAIAYGVHQHETDTKFLVFDLGGGTFDVSILELFEGVMEVKSIAGDNYLGGEDFTELIALHFLKQLQLKKEQLQPKELSLLLKQAEQCKQALAKQTESTVYLTYDEKQTAVTINRAQFEELCKPLILRLRQPIERALRDAGMHASEIQGMILIGGATRMPIIKQTVSRIFGRLPFFTLHPDEAVGLGTSVQIALKERNEALQELILTDVCPYTLGTSVSKNVDNISYSSGHFLPIIERNTPIPVSRVVQVSPLHDQQQFIEIDVYQGESRLVENNIRIGDFNVTLPKGKATQETIDIRYTYDINGLLEVEATVVSTGKKERLFLQQSSENLTEEEMVAQIEKLKAIKIHPRERTENRLLIAQAERIYEELLGSERDYVAQLIFQFEQVLASQNEQLIQKSAAQFKEKIHEIASRPIT
ncbi:molecular chaperone HscC [Fictibacillus macauensis ZFHKF-1]|uniref:Chaperone protein DnaK n=1 Tax=Fictibacillus macauensis ZFHKF-1 TaxID=1196324 RepID=I8AGP5_9BACL|nr:molecular chaperone HscC [Fictibacillus macauensis]EIT84852.1 molecular chaperone HscC [Fictibacillus macauensis ZFHKF-1]